MMKGLIQKILLAVAVVSMMSVSGLAIAAKGTSKRRERIYRFLITLFTICFCGVAYAKPLPLDLIKLPVYFKINVYAKVPGARSLTLGKNGIVFVGTRHAGKVYALLPKKNFSKAKAVILIAQDLKQPNGVAYYQGALYVAEIHQIL